MSKAEIYGSSYDNHFMDIYFSSEELGLNDFHDIIAAPCKPWYPNYVPNLITTTSHDAPTI